MTEEPRGYVIALWGDDGSVDWAYVGDEFDDDFLQLHTLQEHYLVDGRPTEILEFVPVWRSGKKLREHASARRDWWREQLRLLKKEQKSCGDI